MAVSRFSFTLLLLITFLLSRCQLSRADNSIQKFTSTDSQGNVIKLLDTRRPALYTKNFGDCQASSSINVTRFDAGFYKDNMTVSFHLEGNTAVQQDSLMLYIGVFAYGESRFELTFDPCLSHIRSLCPVRAGVPIQANGIIPVGPKDVAGIPDIAFSIPDFEGQAILRLFSNTTQSQIGCYSSVVTNGATFSHPAAVGSALGAFTAIATLSSIAVAIYGTDASSIRNHYTHSVSVFVVFSTFQHIYFTGALSLNWPSVLAAFWSNYAWSAGMVYSEHMQNSINQLSGNGRGNLSTVDGSASENIGSGFDLARIYRRGLAVHVASPTVLKEWNHSKRVEGLLQTRADANTSTRLPWSGSPVKPGLPRPGNYSGFPGVLSEESIPASNAFMTGLLWLLILLAIIAASVPIVKWTIEGLSRANAVKKDRLVYFRANWLRFTEMVVLRTLLIAFFMMMFLTMFQFGLASPAEVTAIAALVFIFLLFGLVGSICYALIYRYIEGGVVSESDKLVLERKKVFKYIPWFRLYLESQRGEKDTQPTSNVTLPWWRVRSTSGCGSVHEDEGYLSKFGWLSGRFRRTRWWFFGAWPAYEFIRAGIYAGASGSPMSQVIGLLVLEIIALIAIVWVRPFEAARINALMVYFLGFSKVATLALSSAFDPRFNLERITTTIIGVVIIVIQSILTILLLIAIVTGAISSYISVTRDRSEAFFKPHSWLPLRKRYLAHVEKAALDLPPPPPAPAKTEMGLKEPSFNVSSVRRFPKIEDERLDTFHPSKNHSRTTSTTSIPYREPTALAALVAARNRAQSAQSQHSWTNFSTSDPMNWYTGQRMYTGSPVSVFSTVPNPPPGGRAYTPSNVDTLEGLSSNANPMSCTTPPPVDPAAQLPKNHGLDDVD